MEDILRDAACFATEDEAPEGLAHRALARQIAGQNAHRNLPSVRTNRKQGAVLWFGGLSAGTLAGAAAAVLIITHLNGNAFRITPGTTSLPSQKLQTSVTKSPASVAASNSTKDVANLGQPTLAALPTVGKQSAPEPHSTERHSSEREIPARLLDGYRHKETVSVSAPRSRSIASRTSSPTKASDAPAVARWKTEPFEETEYQLVTAAYTPEAASGGYASGNDHLQLTPLKMRASVEPSESDPMAGPSLPQY